MQSENFSLRSVRLKQVEDMTGLRRSTIYDRMSKSSKRYDPDFPKSFSLGSRSVAWLESEVVRWLEKRIAETQKK